MLWGMIADRGDAPVLQERKNTGWQPISWRAFGQRIESIGSALLASGLARGDRGCILGATGADWLAIDAGMMSIGMISAGVYPTEPPDRLAYIAGDCGARILFVDSEAQLAKGLAVLERCPNLKAIVAFGFVPLDDHPAVTTLDSWILNCDSDQGRFGDARSQVQADDGAILVYTSGTTGQPKGALVTHGAIACRSSIRRGSITRSRDGAAPPISHCATLPNAISHSSRCMETVSPTWSIPPPISAAP